MNPFTNVPTVAQLIGLLLTIMAIFSFVWVLKSFFQTPDRGAQRGKQLFIALGTIACVSIVLGFFIPGHSVESVVWLGNGLFILALTIFWGAVGAHSVKPNVAFSKENTLQIVTSGPYSKIRHPFYLAYSLTWIAAVFSTGHWWLLINFLVLGCFYYRAASLEERGFLTGPLASQYQNYRDKTGMFFPKIF